MLNYYNVLLIRVSCTYISIYLYIYIYIYMEQEHMYKYIHVRTSIGLLESIYQKYILYFMTFLKTDSINFIFHLSNSSH